VNDHHHGATNLSGHDSSGEEWDESNHYREQDARARDINNAVLAPWNQPPRLFEASIAARLFAFIAVSRMLKRAYHHDEGKQNAAQTSFVLGRTTRLCHARFILRAADRRSLCGFQLAFS